MLYILFHQTTVIHTCILCTDVKCILICLFSLLPINKPSLLLNLLYTKMLKY